MKAKDTPSLIHPSTMRLVLDTNVWLDWLLFDDPAVAAIKLAVAEGKAEVFMDEAGEAELVRVLAYPFGRKTLAADAQAACLAECRRIVRRNEGATSHHAATPLPACSDPDDQKFLELALACGASHLITRDRDLLELARGRGRLLPFRIVTLAQFSKG